MHAMKPSLHHNDGTPPAAQLYTTSSPSLSLGPLARLGLLHTLALAHLDPLGLQQVFPLALVNQVLVLRLVERRHAHILLDQLALLVELHLRLFLDIPVLARTGLLALLHLELCDVEAVHVVLVRVELGRVSAGRARTRALGRGHLNFRPIDFWRRTGMEAPDGLKNPRVVEPHDSLFA
jgi:hypothetical protein